VALTTRGTTAADEPAITAFLGSSKGLHSPDSTAPKIMVAEDGGVIVGLIQFEAPRPDHLRVLALSVTHLPGQEDIARELVEKAIQAQHADRDSCTVSALVYIGDFAAAAVLLGAGFIVNRILTEHNLPRLYYQFKTQVEYIDAAHRYLIPASAVEELKDLLSGKGQTITDVLELDGEFVYEVSRFEYDDSATLQSGEAAAGIAFSGAVLAVMTFLLGFAFASSRYPDSVRVLLIGATIATTMSLIIYASASGELARIRLNAFGRIMKWGNVLSEYGGVFPFIISLPITYTQVTGSRWSAITVSAILSAGLLIYDNSQFAIASRFAWSVPTRVLSVLGCTSPLTGSLLAYYSDATWVWTICVTLVLTSRSIIYLYLRGAESGIAEFRNRGWQVRH
jgi:uncharacterized membrane protein YjfL (UPF0719 family)